MKAFAILFTVLFLTGQPWALPFAIIFWWSYLEDREAR